MSNYYTYQSLGATIAEVLMEGKSYKGWKVYGYHADESDMMVDYWSPAYWEGIAEKNGYILVFNKSFAREPQEVYAYSDGKNGNVDHAKFQAKIKKLEQMTMDRGASKQEEESAKKMIEKLLEKANEENDNHERTKYVKEIIPGYMANPPRCNWHLEKDGVVILKGNGMLKFAKVEDYFKPRYDNMYHKTENDIQLFGKDKEEWERKVREEFALNPHFHNAQEVENGVKWAEEKMENDLPTYNKFASWFNKVDKACGSMVGDGDIVTYEKVKETVYKKEMKPFETTNGSIKEGQCFILKSNFNYGCRKGLVYRIHMATYNGKQSFYAYKLNGKFTKECTGRASRNNHWNTFGDKFNSWIEKGNISWCDVREVKVPYEVEKVKKKVVKTSKRTDVAYKEHATETEMDIDGIDYKLTEDEHTKTHERLWVMEIITDLTKEQFNVLRTQIKELGGYYSRYKHGFIFKENPENKLKEA